MLNKWRILILRLFGAKINKNVVVYSSVKFWRPGNLEIGSGSCLGPRVNIYNTAKITIGQNTIVSQDTEICTASHDISSVNFDLITDSITIGSCCWLGAKVFIGPGVRINDHCILGACTVCFQKEVEAGVHIGNPIYKLRESPCTQFLF